MMMTSIVYVLSDRSQAGTNQNERITRVIILTTILCTIEALTMTQYSIS